MSRSRHRGGRARGVWALAFCALLAACKPPPPPTAEQLAFPVLVLFPDSGVVRHDDAADLKQMSTQRVAGANSAPYLIDSNLDVYRLDRLESVHGGLWLMANPVGRTEVTFELVREARADAAKARELLTEREIRLRGADGAPMRQKLAAAGTLREMLVAIGR
jgi:hypothetical protein